MAARYTKTAKILLRLLITAVLLAWVFRQVDAGEFRQTVMAANWLCLLAVWALTALLFWIRAIKMQIILRKQDCHAGVSTIFGATVITALYSLILPGMLSTGVKWYILRKDTGKGSNVLSSMLYNQISTVVVMTVFGLAALMLTDPTILLRDSPVPPWILPVSCAALLAGVILTSILMLDSTAGGKAIGAIAYVFRPLPAALRSKGERLLAQIGTFQTVGAGFHLGIAAFTTFDTLIGGAVTYVLAAKAAHINAPLTTFVWLCAMVFILGRLPISLANLGVRESVLVGLLSFYGVDKSAALLMSMILFSALVFMAIVGAGYQLAWMSLRRDREVIDQ